MSTSTAFPDVINDLLCAAAASAKNHSDLICDGPDVPARLAELASQAITVAANDAGPLEAALGRDLTGSEFDLMVCAETVSTLLARRARRPGDVRTISTVQGMLASVIGCAERTVRRSLRSLRGVHGAPCARGHAEKHVVEGRLMGMYDGSVLCVGGWAGEQSVRLLDGHRPAFGQDVENGRSAPARLRSTLSAWRAHLNMPEPDSRRSATACPLTEGLGLLAALLCAAYSRSAASLWLICDDLDARLQRMPHVTQQAVVAEPVQSPVPPVTRHLPALMRWLRSQVTLRPPLSPPLRALLPSRVALAWPAGIRRVLII